METGEPVQAGIWVQQRGAQAGQVLVEFACQPVRDAGGAVAGVLLYAADASAHVRDRNRLEVLAGDLAASEERYRTLFETMPQGIVHYDADGSIIGANRAAGEILGMDLTTVTSWPVVPEGQAVREDGTPFRPGTCRSRWRCGPARSSPTWSQASGTGRPVSCAGCGSPPSRTRAMSRAGPAAPTRSSPT